MKIYFYFLLIFLLVPLLNQAQNASERHINVAMLGKDSVIMPFTSRYELIEDSCAEIVRYARYDFQKKIFKGGFKDVSKTNPKLTIASGYYSEDGFKDGDFTTYYLNGNLQSKGNFKNDKYMGKWEIYYENGSPKLVFEVVDNKYRIIDAWDDKNKQTVKAGAGKYSVNYMFDFNWLGNVVDGRPDGVWELLNTDNPNTQPVMTESFINGKFDKGGNKVLTYTDSSHIVLVSNKYLPLINAETLRISSANCSTLNKMEHVVNAKYKDGPAALANEIRYALSDIVGEMNMQRFYELNIEGEINESGKIDNLIENGQTNPRIIAALKKSFPILEPAKINDKAVRQKIVIRLAFGNGECKYSYAFLPIRIN
jgi:antitoxin component YwqK of YwqJK toxin-antitoxin module